MLPTREYTTMAAGGLMLCPKCNGDGKIRVYHEDGTYEYHYEECPTCKGKGAW